MVKKHRQLLRQMACLLLAAERKQEKELDPSPASTNSIDPCRERVSKCMTHEPQETQHYTSESASNDTDKCVKEKKRRASTTSALERLYHLPYRSWKVHQPHE